MVESEPRFFVLLCFVFLYFPDFPVPNLPVSIFFLSHGWEKKTATRNRVAELSRPGLEPGTYGLTCCTGSHRPLRLQSGLYHLPRGEPHVKSLRIPQFPDCLGQLTAFPADCPIRRIVTLSRTDGSQGVPAYGAVLPPASRPGHSYC